MLIILLISHSGKSSFLQTLLYLLEIRGGQILVDGIRLDEMHPDVIRNRFNTIPQNFTPTLGTVRETLDPYSKHSDKDLTEALDKVSLGHFKNTKLSLGVVFEPGEISGGERQLFALATAILRKSKIVLMDEITSQ
jgi:ATP-binding cassette subfamily C (CFTR/MRP) protein 1